MSGLLLKDFYTIDIMQKTDDFDIADLGSLFLPGRDGSTYIIMCFFMWYDDGDDFYLLMINATGKICDDPANFKKAYVLEKYVLHMIFSLLGEVMVQQLQ